MKYLKIQNDLMKKAFARDDYKHKSFRCSWGVDSDDEVWVFPDGLYGVRLSCPFCYIDPLSVFNTPQIPINKIIDDSKAVDAVHTNRIVVDNERNLHIFEVGKEKVYVNEKLMKYFDLDESTFKGTNRKAPIFIYENNTLVGLVLPANYTEKE